MKRGHVTSIYYYLNIVKMAASTIEGGGGWNAIRYQILDPLKIKYQISDPQKNQISDIMSSQKSDIWL